MLYPTIGSALFNMISCHSMCLSVNQITPPKQLGLMSLNLRDDSSLNADCFRLIQQPFLANHPPDNRNKTTRSSRPTSDEPLQFLMALSQNIPPSNTSRSKFH